MGVFKVRVRFFSLRDNAKAHDLEVTVDTGSTLSVIPREVAESLDVRPVGQRWFLLANRERISREVGYVGVKYEERDAPTLVVLGGPQDAPLLGAVALESMGFEADPISETLRPTIHFLMRVTRTGRPAARLS
ncbi:MAG TPA: aspartyl protease family protein [Thermoplasmata archaeon]|jgi:clan AA aspartic protease